MNIAFIFPRFSGPYGGERLLINLARGLQMEGHTVTIYTHKRELLKDLDSSDIKIIENSFYPSIKNHQFSTLLDLFLMPMFLLKIKNNFDLLIGMGWQSAFGIFLYKKIFMRNMKKKLIYYCLEPPRLAYDLKEENLEKVKGIKKILFLMMVSIISFIDKISVNSIDNIISISDWTADQVKRIYNKKSIIIYPGIELERFTKYSKKEAKALLHISTDKVVYLSVSKLHKRKRLDVALDIFGSQHKSNSVFFIIGDGPDKSYIEEYIKKQHIKHVELLGQLSDDSVSLYMQAADYFIFTAKNEPFGIAPLEAKAAGCKVIPDEPLYKPLDLRESIKNNIAYFIKVSYEKK